MWFAVLVYAVSDVMEKIASSGDRRTHNTLLYHHVFYDKLAMIFVNLWNGLLTQSVAQQMSCVQQVPALQRYVVQPISDF